MESRQRGFCLVLAAGVGVAFAILACGTASAQVWAYEGFEGVSDGALAGTAATGSGFADVWDITNGAGGASTTEAAGLAYPSTYPGTHTAIGGNGRVTGATGDNGFLALDFDAVADAAINGADEVYISVLAKNVSQSVTDAGLLDATARTTFNLAAEYPRNSGYRIMNVGNGSNSALGTVGNGGNWNGGGQSVYDVGDSNPEVVDTWSAFNFNDANNIFTGNGGNTNDGDPSPNYNSAPHNYLGPVGDEDGVDHLVLSIDASGPAGVYRLQVNPQADGSNEGEISWVHTDNGGTTDVPFFMKAFGVEAGNDSSERPVGDMVFDEIYIGGTFEDAAGFFQVPEPSSLTILCVMLLGFGAVRRR